MDWPTTIQETEETITQWRNSGLNHEVAVLLLTKHLKFLMAYCERKGELTKKYNEAKTSYYRQQYREAEEQLHAMMTDYLKIMNDHQSEIQIYYSGIGGC